MPGAPDRSSPRGSSQWTLGLIAAAAGAVLVLAWLLPAPRRGSDAGRDSAVGRQLLALNLQPLAEGPAVGQADLAGQVVLLNFWGTWCGPCRAELPHLAALAARRAEGSGFRLLAVSCGATVEEDDARLRAETRAFLERHGLRLPVYLDRGFVTRRHWLMLDDGGGLAYPLTLLLDRQGTIRGVWRGYAPGSELEMEAAIDALLAEPATAADRGPLGGSGEPAEQLGGGGGGARRVDDRAADRHP